MDNTTATTINAEDLFNTVCNALANCHRQESGLLAAAHNLGIIGNAELDLADRSIYHRWEVLEAVQFEMFRDAEKLQALYFLNRDAERARAAYEALRDAHNSLTATLYTVGPELASRPVSVSPLVAGSKPE